MKETQQQSHYHIKEKDFMSHIYDLEAKCLPKGRIQIKVDVVVGREREFDTLKHVLRLKSITVIQNMP